MPGKVLTTLAQGVLEDAPLTSWHLIAADTWIALDRNGGTSMPNRICNSRSWLLFRRCCMRSFHQCSYNGRKPCDSEGLGNLEVAKQSSVYSNCMEYTGHVKMRDRVAYRCIVRYTRLAKSLSCEQHTKVSLLDWLCHCNNTDDFKTCESVSMKGINLSCSHSSQAIV